MMAAPVAVRTRRPIAVAIAVAFAATIACADSASAAGRVYRLGERSTYQSGCFPPCLCPLGVESPVRGTFKLLPTGFDGLFHTFAVSDVSWIASPGGSDRLLTGSGTYRIGGEFALQQRLELDLRIDGQPLQRFDSGLIPANGATFPAITVTVSINDMVCFDTVVAIDAAPVPLGEIQRYRLAGSSTFQQGCGLTPDSACDCPLGPALPIRGSFRLVPLQRGPLFDEFAIIDVRWQALATVPPAPRRVIRVRGSGFYRVGGEFAVEQQLSLALGIGGQSPVPLDSGVVLGDGEFPARIDVPVITDSNCFDRRIDLHARQGPPFARWWRAAQR